MKRRLKRLGVLLATGLLTFGTAAPIDNVETVYAHSGRTDAAGGHKDNKNKSGLGSYHYHCGGHPAHLHDGGVCPYSTAGTSSSQGSVETSIPKPERIQITSAPTEMKVGENQGFAYSVENGASSAVKVESSNTNVIVVNDDQTIKAVGVGQADIKVSSENATETFNVVVKPVDVEAIEVDKDRVHLEIRETKEIIANVVPENATDKTLKWSSTEKNILEVDNGKLIPQKEGIATVIIEASNGIKKEVEVEVYCIEVDSVKIDDSKMEYLKNHVIDIEGSIELKAIVNPTDATYPDIVWSSSNEDVVKIKNGEFEVVGKGKVVIKATAKNGVSDEIELEIIDDSLSSGATIGTVVVLILGGGIILRQKRKKNS